jgi:hypothetical protein|tara:strand:+ start:171 stop:512 length:342 start_codon:yes stop_codon:yes gene_type:complete
MDTLSLVLFPFMLLYMSAAFAAQSESEFGSAGNPVKTQGINGAREYIDSLDCENGAIPEYRHESAPETGASGDQLEKYIMRCEADNVKIFTIYLDPNHTKTDTRPVRGFTSWL